MMPDYIPLGPDDVIREGDEFLSLNEDWIPVCESIGFTPRHPDFDKLQFRRPSPTKEDGGREEPFASFVRRYDELMMPPTSISRQLTLLEEIINHIRAPHLSDATEDVPSNPIRVVIEGVETKIENT